MSAILIQIRAGKIGLNDFLYSVKRAETDRCSCPGATRQTAEHTSHVSKVGDNLDRTRLWQGTRNRDMKTFLDELATAKRSAIFMARLGLLGQLGRAGQVEIGVEETPKVAKGDIPSTSDQIQDEP